MKEFKSVAMRTYELDGVFCHDELRLGRTSIGSTGFELVLSEVAYADYAESDRYVRMTPDEVLEWLEECPQSIVRAAPTPLEYMSQVVSGVTVA